MNPSKEPHLLTTIIINQKDEQLLRALFFTKTLPLYNPHAFAQASFWA